ncbi:HAD-IB family hydrolase [Nevskia sp.]|uniref:HAD-IB family hydrolase n=1 Tax=Nevskia sp. TaxID=1929292 RepID=UPI0025D1F543|nr:HAD-IB family hydrolase [Nevskia sp.]
MSYPALQQHIAEILSGPRGARVAAFFDYDGTLIDGYSVMAYLGERFRQRRMGAGEMLEIASFSMLRDPSEADFEELVRAGMRRWAGKTEDEMIALWRRLFRSRIASTVFPESWELVLAHQRMGHTVALASSATRYQVLPMAEELGIDHLLCTTAEVRDGQLTGEIAGRTAWGEGKAEVVRRFAQSRRIDLTRSHGYANGREDIAFLNTVGKPLAINPAEALAQHARRQSWPVLQFEQRRKVSPQSRARTVAAYSWMAATLAGGMAFEALGGPRRRAVELIGNVASDVGLAIAGIDVRIQGEHNLWARRPAVFLINHQSGLDLIVGAKIFRRDFTGVAKKEAAKAIGFGKFMQMADIAFIDRANSSAARQALGPVQEKLAKGLSVVIAPEGTRSYTPRLGAFKKGAFHIAMQAGVPVIPVVIRNAGAMMWRDTLWMRPGTVDVAVLPPVETEGWTLASLDSHIAEIRQQFLDTLARWPDPSPKPRPARKEKKS